jgi:hypothetical protein
MCTVVLVVLSSATLHAEHKINGEVAEVLYYWGGDKAETSKIGTLSPVSISAPAGSPNLDILVDELGRFVQDYLSNLPNTKPPISMTLEDIQKGKTQAQTAVLYRMEARGVKGSGAIPLGGFDSTTGLDKSKVYALLPLLSGYDCALAHLAYAGGKWTLQDEDGKELPDIRCQPKKLERWIVEVKVVNGDATLQDSLARAAYDAIDRLGPSKYRQLGSFRKESELVAEQRRATPPMAQIAIQQAEANFVLNLSVR